VNVLSGYLTSVHPGQLSLAILLLVKGAANSSGWSCMWISLD